MRRQDLAPFVLVAALGVIAGASSREPRATAAPSAPDPASQKARVDAAQKAYGLAEAQHQAGTATVEAVYTWSRRWAEAQRASGVGAAMADHGKRMKSLEAAVKAKVGAGAASALDAQAAAYFVAEADAL